MTAFWFAPTSPRTLAILRIGLAVVLLVDVLGHWPHVVESYSSAGRPMTPFASTGEWLPVPTPFVAVAATAALAFGLASAAVGFLTRFSLLTSVVLLTWLSLLDFPQTLTKYTAIATHLLLLLSLSGTSHVWSVDAWLFGGPDRVRLASAWPQRLMQLLVCHVYLGAAVTKWRLHFATGDTLAYSLVDDRWAGGWFGLDAGSWLAADTRLLVLASFATVAFEFAFPLLVWFRRTRRPMLLAAVLFHLGMAGFLSLRVFTPLMLVGLVAFVRERDLHWLPTAGAREVVPSPGSGVRWGRLAAAVLVWFGLGVGALTLGVAVQRASDPYGVFGNGRPLVLERLTAKEAEELLSEGPVPAVARVHRVALGTRSNEWQVFGDAERLGGGDELHVVVQFVRERPPVNVEIVLVDPGDEPVEVRSGYAPSSVTRWRGAFVLPRKAETGDWSVEVFVQGELVERRVVRVD